MSFFFKKNKLERSKQKNKEVENWLNDESCKTLLFFIVPLGCSGQKLHE